MQALGFATPLNSAPHWRTLQQRVNALSSDDDYEMVFAATDNEHGGSRCAAIAAILFLQRDSKLANSRLVLGGGEFGVVVGFPRVP
jgi:hypothetical protein